MIALKKQRGELMKIIKSFFWILLIQCALLQNFVLAEQKDTNLFCNVGKDKILFATQWDVGLNNPLKVIVKERFDKKEKINIRELAIYQQVGNSFKKMYGFETPDYPVSISQTQDSGGQLLTTCTGGSAYH